VSGPAADSLFPGGYAQSRNTFLALATAAGAHLASFDHTLRGPNAEPLATDVARFGEPDAQRLLIVSSATHGVEGLCGGGIQAALLSGGLHRKLPRGVALLFVHAVNPHGFAHLRRTNEDNIDLNRNFRDHDAPYPDDAAYAEVHPMLVPADWDGPARRDADAQLAQFIAERGWRTLQAAISHGQYSFPDGLFYGGRKAAWSNRTWRAILARFGARARYVAVVDLHSGLGARGACELISGAVGGTTEYQLAQHWFGDGIVFPGRTSTAPAASGFMGASLAGALPGAAGALVVAEFGTVPFNEIFDVLRADNWLHAHGDPGSRFGHDVKAEMRRTFAGDDAPWQSQVVERAVAICRGALAGLAGTPDAASETKGTST
jgi:hypothetical protein